MESLSEPSVDEEWEVESILKERTKKTKDKKTGRIKPVKEHLVKWLGYKDPTWEPEENLENCQELLKDFLLSQIMKKLKSSKKPEKTENDSDECTPKLNNKKRKSPDTKNNITDDEQEKSVSTVSNSISKSHEGKNKKKKKEEISNDDNDNNNKDKNDIKEIEMNYDIEIEKKEKPKTKDKSNKDNKVNKEKFIENIDVNTFTIKDECDVNKDNKDISGIKVIRINYMKIPENPNDGIEFNIKFKKKGKTFIETFNTKNDNIPNECLAQYYEMFIHENFKGCVFSKEMLFD